MRFPHLMIIVLLAWAWTAHARAQTKPSPPNVIFILIDDMGYAELGCFGNRAIRTPNIDRLASEGVRFTQFYVNAPICSPSRVAFTTGQYPGRWRIHSFLASRSENEKRGMAQWLDPQAPSLARMLAAAGYRTGHFGKWHMGGTRDIGDAPLISEYGFAESLTQFEGLGDRLLPTFETMFKDREHNAHPLSLASAELGKGKAEFVTRADVTRRFVERSMQFVRAARDAKQPFYLNLWPDDVHDPFEPSPTSRGDGSKQAMYQGVLQELDAALGPLFDLVRDDPELRANTMILLSSDNGHDPVIKPAATLRGHKGTLYEGGIRSPLIVWWPGGQAGSAGKVNEQSVLAGMDLAPTLLSLTRVQAPTDVRFDGRDMSAAFRGEQPERREPVFWVRPPDRPGPKGSFPDFAMRDRSWKLLIEADGSEPQLFDVTADPDETKNLAAEHPDRVASMREQLQRWRDEMPKPLLPRVQP